MSNAGPYAYARTVGVENGTEEEIWCCTDVLVWTCVSSPWVRRRGWAKRQCCLDCSINIFNLIRIAWRETVSSPGITFEYALLICFSVLESQLGIVLACVPAIQPVLRELGSGDTLKGTRSRCSSKRKFARYVHASAGGQCTGEHGRQDA